MTFPSTCGACTKQCETRMFVTSILFRNKFPILLYLLFSTWQKIEIPYFQEVIVMASTCEDCGYRNSEVGFPLGLILLEICSRHMSKVINFFWSLGSWSLVVLFLKRERKLLSVWRTSLTLAEMLSRLVFLLQFVFILSLWYSCITHLMVNIGVDNLMDHYVG